MGEEDLYIFSRYSFMSKIQNYNDAENEAKTWLNDKYPKNLGAKFTKILGVIFAIMAN